MSMHEFAVIRKRNAPTIDAIFRRLGKSQRDRLPLVQHNDADNPPASDDAGTSANPRLPLPSANPTASLLT